MLFSLELKNTWNDRAEHTSKQQKLATFLCYDYGTKASKAVTKIITEQKEYYKCSSFVLNY